MAFTSMLKRAIWTFHTIADELDLNWVPHIKDWRLNEKHYGALQGLEKDQIADVHTKENVDLWRKSYDTPPPSLSEKDYRNPRNDVKYA
jgi:2,3-bisphosphoglycerate-dependent phosphoglycerate mutase